MLTSEWPEVFASAARPMARSLPWATVLGVLGLAWAPLTLTMVRGGTDLVAAYSFAAVVGSSVLAFAVDDDAIEVTSATPVPLAQRNSLRLVELLLVYVLVATIAVIAGASRDPAVAAALDDRLAEAAAVAGLGVAVASVAARDRTPNAGAVGAVAGSCAVGLIAVLAQRFDWLPGIMESQHHDWWWLVAAVGSAMSAWSWRDPARGRVAPW